MKSLFVFAIFMAVMLLITRSDGKSIVSTDELTADIKTAEVRIKFNIPFYVPNT